MSTFYNVNVPVKLSELEQSTNFAVNVRYSEQFTDCCYIIHNGNQFECTHNEGYLLGIVYRYHGDIEALFELFENRFGNDFEVYKEEE